MSLDGVRTYDQWIAYWREVMGLRKWNDSKGWSRGARGIDDEKGANDFVWPFVDTTAMARQFDRTWSHASMGPAKAEEYSGSKDTKSWSESPDYDTKKGGGDGGSPF